MSLTQGSVPATISQKTQELLDGSGDALWVISS
jgi:hypothetical protein